MKSAIVCSNDLEHPESDLARGTSQLFNDTHF